MTYRINEANAWNGWDPLKQVVLGNVFEPEFFEDLKDHKLRDLLQKLLYETHEDLDNIQKTLESLGVDVVRLHPNLTQAATLAETTTHGVGYSNIMEYYEEQKSAFNGIPKPALMPRDYLITMGDKILLTQQYPEFHKFMTSSGQNFINPDCLDMRLTVDPKKRKFRGPLRPRKEYVEYDTTYKAEWFDVNIPEGTFSDDPDYIRAMGYTWGFWAPTVTRVGDTLILDTKDVENLDDAMIELYPQFKRTNTANGGHSDATFNLPKPGLVICASYLDKDTFKETCPGWDVLKIRTGTEKTMESEYGSWQQQKHLTDGKWWTPDAKDNPVYTKFIEEWLNTWTGYSEETQFEVNMLSVNENTILSMNYQKQVHDKLKEHKIDPIYCRFRHRNFWDGGLHCLTLDTVREGGMQSYF